MARGSHSSRQHSRLRPLKQSEADDFEIDHTLSQSSSRSTAELRSWGKTDGLLPTIPTLPKHAIYKA